LGDKLDKLFSAGSAFKHHESFGYLTRFLVRAGNHTGIGDGGMLN
jgi:hypothetical protein